MELLRCVCEAFSSSSVQRHHTFEKMLIKRYVTKDRVDSQRAARESLLLYPVRRRGAQESGQTRLVEGTCERADMAPCANGPRRGQNAAKLDAEWQRARRRSVGV